MIEWYLPGRVQCQFREPQDQPDDSYAAIFACRMTQVSWGPGIPTVEAVDNFRHLVGRLWAYGQGLADLGTT